MATAKSEQIGRGNFIAFVGYTTEKIRYPGVCGSPRTPQSKGRTVKTFSRSQFPPLKVEDVEKTHRLR